VVDQLADYLERALAGRIPVHPWIPPADMAGRWATAFPDEPPAAADLAALIDRVVADSQHQHHPGHMGHQVSAPLPLAVLCDLAAALLNNGMAAYESGPAATAIEAAVVGELARRLGFPAGADGCLTSGGSAGNLTALLAARQVRAPHGAARLAIVTSDQAHYSVARAARILGLGPGGVIAAATDARYRMRPEAAAAAIDRARAAGVEVLAIVASACSTATGAIDPLAELAAVAAERGVWLHVDGAHGASAVLSARYRDGLAGIDRADSVVWDAHKMLLQPALITAVLFRRGADARAAFTQDASYLFASGDPERDTYDLGLRTLECTKRMMGVKLYASFALLGTRVFGDYVAATYDLARAFAARLRAAPDFELVCEPDTNIVCFRFAPPGVEPGALDALQARARDLVCGAGEQLLVQTRLPMGVVLRVTLANPFTTEAHVGALMDAIRRTCPTT
jgi:L-2,4-diaminobutyrate decarboxylase